MKKIFLMFAFILVVVSAKAQKATKDTSTFFKKNDLVLNFTAPTISSYHRGEEEVFGLMYRRNFNKVSLRFKVGGTYDKQYLSIVDKSMNNHYIKASIGLQKNVPLTKFSQFYWGADIFYADRNRFSSDSAMLFLRNTNSIGLSPLVGIKFSFGKRFIFGAENSGNLGWNNSVKKPANYNPLLTIPVRRQQSFDFNSLNNIRIFMGLKF